MRQEEFVKQLLSEFESVEEDDQLGLLANRLGAADISNTSQLTDVTTNSFISQHQIAVVTFYQKCKFMQLLESCSFAFCRVCPV